MSNLKTPTISQVLQALNQLAPLGTAEDWDNVGLLIGDPAQETRGAVISIDLTFETVQLAVEKGYKLILNHHPCIFPKSRGLGKVVAGSPLFEALKNGIAVAAYHTNFDQCSLEVVEQICTGLGLNPKGRLIDKPAGSLKKLVTYLPADHLEKVRSALCEAGAGHIGCYDFCTFHSSGHGTFRGGEGTQPWIGQAGQLEKVEEVRLETIFPDGMGDRVLAALFKAHPYEEVAYDIYPVEQRASSKGLVQGHGYGFWGEFTSPKAFSDIVKDVKSLFNIHGFWITGPVPDQVTRIGFVAGKGASFVDAASAVKCDLFITGEAGYHTALGGLQRGVTVIELGHRESEKFFVETMKRWVTDLGLETTTVHRSVQQFWSGGMK